MFGFMQRLRTSGLPAILLTLVMGFGVVLPETGHSLAHRRGGVHESHDVVGHSHAHHAPGVEVSTGHADDHPHPDRLATLTGKPLLAYAVATRTIAWLLSELDNGGGIAPAVARTLAPIQNGHGPPPPTRAPPTN
jgi:hypothetical protein